MLDIDERTFVGEHVSDVMSKLFSNVREEGVSLAV